MKIVLAAIAALATVLIAAPAHADTAPTCPDPDSSVTQAQVNQLDIGMRKFQVFAIFGSRGVRDKDNSNGVDQLVRQWVWCDGFVSQQGVTFARDAAGHWVIADIG
jgi:hypothetical protein